MRILEEIFLMITIVIIAFMVSIFIVGKLIKPECLNHVKSITTNPKGE